MSISKPKCALLATAWPILPKPIIPSFLPVTLVPSKCVGLQPVQFSALSSLSPSPTLLAAISNKDIAMSAVQSVKTLGVLDTVIPSSLALEISI